ncbi:MAG: nitroreductase family protein, partial [Ilumatobacteraceae bacterium]
AYEPAPAGVERFAGPAPEVPLRPVHDRFAGLLASRRSGRELVGEPLHHRDIERVLATVGPTPDGRRMIAEAGGLDLVHVFAVARRVAGPLGGRLVRYDHRRHAVADVGPVPDDDELRRLFSIPDDQPLAALVVVFVVDLDAVTRKYGPRGGRFAMQQVGLATANVGLRLAHDGLPGYVLGGGLDDDVLGWLGLGHTGARYGGAVACGGRAGRAGPWGRRRG